MLSRIRGETWLPEPASAAALHRKDRRSAASSHFRSASFLPSFRMTTFASTALWKSATGCVTFAGNASKDSTFHKLATEGVRLLALRRPPSSVRRNDLSGQPHAAANVVLCDLSVHRDAPRRERQRTSAVARRHVQDRLSHGMQIRDLMGKVDGFQVLKGHVEIDETYFGGHRRKSAKMSNKTIVMGMKERGGRIETRIVPDVRTASLRPVVLETVEKGATVSTDELAATAYSKGDGYIHGAVDHRARNGLGPIIKPGRASRPTARSRFGSCSKRPSTERIFISARSTLTGTSASFLSARIIARCGTRCSIF